MAARGEAQAMEVDGVMMLICQYFAKCANGTLKVYDHPALGYVPTCDRCATKMRIKTNDLHPIELDVQN
jgi:hypothetical protein